jgi:hypothetical protein
VHRAPSVKQALAGRGYFEDALRWMEIHGGAEGQELAAHWRSLDFGDIAPPAGLDAAASEVGALRADGESGRSRRRRRRRRGRRPPPTPPPL